MAQSETLTQASARTGHADRGTAAGRGSAAEEPSPRPLLAAAFLCSLVIPAYFFLGGLRLSPYRTILIISFVPLFFMWIGGRFGPLNTADKLIAGFSFWIAVALLANHSVGRIWQFTGITIIETLGAYMLARATVRSRESFTFFVKVLFGLTALLLPIGAYESFSGGTMLINKVFDPIFPVYYNNHAPPRWGLNRAQGPFEHSILFGVFCVAGMGMFYYVYGFLKSRFAGILRTIVSGAAMFFSLSMGAYIAMIMQVGLMIYVRISAGIPKRWNKLNFAVLAVYIFLSFASNRGPILLFIQEVSFGSYSSYARVIQWRYGTDEIMNSPLVGIGLNDWHRPSYLKDSVDNFWLLQGMRYGLPGVGLLIAAVLVTIVKLGRMEIPEEWLDRCRRGYLVSLGGICLSLATVHAWNALYVFLMFLIGAGGWMLSRAEEQPAQGRDRKSGRRDSGDRTGQGAKTPERNASAPATGNRSVSRAGAAETSASSGRDGPTRPARPGRRSGVSRTS
jgi:hypothetical protein